MMAKVKDTQKLIEFLSKKLSDDDLKAAVKMVLDTCKEYTDCEIEKQINIYSEN